ncbi:MAG: hypothetical protein OXI39_11960 [Gemmatimonadota bacterium]|uniref:MerR family transcriptional regulator n=1 Tax=Candidatus Palauibacter scopulicola TaxID=3056741 RepID=UPI002383AE6F|nr:MerR family transcriptional regulator [Candidatus Palauibacter scopulicola]MDE2663703.1 hypothetical protein [Candidatus Palauibacter scopulicola]
MRSYTARELEEETGFSRRTIAYYVQVGLLPRVGRRGPKTRYPKLVRDRLLFIRRVREAEGAGRVPATPLREIGAVFEGSSPELIAGVADGRIAVTADLLSAGSAETDSRLRTEDVAERHEAPVAFAAPRARHAALEDRLMVREEEAYWAHEGRAASLKADMAEAPYAAPRARRDVDDSELAGLLTALRDVTSREIAPGNVETWSRIEIAPGVALSVRDIADEHAALLDAVARQLRHLLSDG